MVGYLYGNRINMKVIELVSGRLIPSIVTTAILISLIVYISRPEMFYGKTTFVDMKIGLWHGVTLFFLYYLAFAAGIVLILSIAKATDIFNSLGERSLYVYLWHGIALYGLSDFFGLAIRNAESHIAVVGPLLLSGILCAFFSLKFVKLFTDAIHNSLRSIIVK